MHRISTKITLAPRLITQMIVKTSPAVITAAIPLPMRLGWHRIGQWLVRCVRILACRLITSLIIASPPIPLITLLEAKSLSV
jgi:hypothetical protein